MIVLILFIFSQCHVQYQYLCLVSILFIYQYQFLKKYANIIKFFNDTLHIITLDTFYSLSSIELNIHHMYIQWWKMQRRQNKRKSM